LVIDLTREEKKALFQFLSLYLVSLFILFAVIAYLFYDIQYRMNYQNIKNQMHLKANELSSKIIHAHMAGKNLSLEELTKNEKFTIAFYDKNKNALTSNIEDKIDFSNHISDDDKNFILIDKGAFGHLGVTYTVIKENNFIHKIDDIKKKIFIQLLLLYIFISIVGYFLAKLFIRPIQAKRVKLNTFIKDSTHELNTPISALLMSIKPRDEMSEKEYNRIKISSNRISDIYKDLTYLFLQNNQPKKEKIKLLSINKELKNQIEHLSPLSEQKKLRVTQTYNNELSYKIDEESLIRLLNNLLSNAIKYNKIGGEIKISIKDNRLSIQDNGIGIDKEHQKDIYDRFYRATSQSGGFGIGLSIVYKICKNYNIKIDMKSEKNIGTEFNLTF
jgi:two-component system OmpR family sensor kinase